MRRMLHIAFLLGMVFSAKAQLSFEATGKYGKLWDIKYDQHTPNRVYALTLVNHIMISEDNGVSWKILYSFPDDKTRMTGLKIAPGGNAITFIALNNYDFQTNGVYVYSLDSHTIIRHYITPNWADNPTVTTYSMYGEAGNAILLHTSYQIDFSPFTKVFYSKDKGNTWSEVYYSSNYSTIQINNVAISPVDSSKIFLARGLGAEGVNGGLFVSEDAGNHYVQFLDGKPVDPIAFDPAEPNKILVGSAISFGAEAEGLYKSTDGGNSFNPVTTITFNDQTLNNITTIAFDPTNSSNIWVLDENEIIKTTNGGTTWKNTVFTPDNTTYTYGTSISFDPLNGNRLFIASDGWPQYSADGGATLTQAKNPFCNATKVSFGNYTGDKHLYYTTLAGYLDKNIATANTLDYLVGSPFIVNGRTRVTIADSTVQGRVFIFTPGDGFFNTSILQYSDDYGATLNSLPSDDFSNRLEAFAKDPDHANVYYIAYSSFGSGSMYRLDFSDPGNIHADNITLPTSGVVIGIVPVAGNSGTLYIAQDFKVYKSIDGGANWLEKSTGLDLAEGVDFILDMHCNPLNPAQFILATNKGLYLSKDSAENWAVALPDFTASRVKFSAVTNGQIIAATLTGSIVSTELAYSQNGGATWTTVDAPALENLQSRDVDFHFMPTDIDVYFSTSDLGVVKYTVSGLTDPLPLYLISFSGTKSNGLAKLQWKTSNEQSLRQYELERSVDGSTFNNIHTTAAYNTAGDHLYNYNDPVFKSISGNAYYRLKMVDIDGHYRYSPIVSLKNEGSNPVRINIYPNPLINQANLNIVTNTAGNYSVKITDAAGKTCLQKVYSIPDGNTVINVPVNNFAKGIYILTTQNADGSTTQLRFVKQ